ncbi:hypothetical protein KLF50_14955 (plasmid) [Clostridium perfringens]|uniref:hypothetical protein n=1 Tax=Clostridium perfringens TaxID=1502 RepID=UPI001CC95077|nr:hypothetical protein [Clostridium perfringens]UBK83463.1 hypothetical protein KLF50_14955 [Clostridium perfringens]
MDKYTIDEMINAVTVIKEVCDQHDCWDCPFKRGSSTCVINKEVPEDWEINQPTTAIFR